MRYALSWAVRLLAVAGIGLLSAGAWAGGGRELGPRPQLLYSLRIDCAHGAIRREGTAARYTIVGISERGTEVSFMPWEGDDRRLTEEDCRRGVAPFAPGGALPDSLRIRRLQIAFDAERLTHDALFLDSLQLTLTAPGVADSIGWDVDGGNGWCLSTDVGDAGGDWRSYVYDGQCYPCVEFSLLPFAEGDSIVDGEWSRTAAPGYAECLATD